MAIFLTAEPSGDKLFFQRAFGESVSTYDENAIFQKDILTKNQYYIVETYIDSVIAGLGTVSMNFKSFDTIHTYNTTGLKRFIDKAITDTLFIQYVSDAPTFGDNFRGIKVSYFKVRPIPTYSLKKYTDNTTVQTFSPSEIVQENPDTDVYGDYLKLTLDLSVLAEDVYYLEFEDEGVTYQTEPFNVKLEHGCTIELSWNDSGNPYNFLYNDIGGFTQVLRVDAKLWKPKYGYDRNEVFVDSKGNRLLTYVRQDKSKILTVAEMPEYCHDALALGLKHSSFMIDGEEYVFEGDEYSPSWRKSSENAPVEVEVRRQDVNLVKSNC